MRISSTCLARCLIVPQNGLPFKILFSKSFMKANIGKIGDPMARLLAVVQPDVESAVVLVYDFQPFQMPIVAVEA